MPSTADINHEPDHTTIEIIGVYSQIGLIPAAVTSTIAGIIWTPLAALLGLVAPLGLVAVHMTARHLGRPNPLNKWYRRVSLVPCSTSPQEATRGNWLAVDNTLDAWLRTKLSFDVEQSDDTSPESEHSDRNHKRMQFYLSVASFERRARHERLLPMAGDALRKLVDVEALV